MRRHLEFFGLREDPFRLTPDRDFYFPARGHAAMLEAVRFGLEQGEGFIVVTGEVGAGKTMLMRMLMSGLKEADRGFVTAMIVSPLITPRQLVQAVLCDSGLAGEKETARAGLDRLVRFLNQRLYGLARQGKKLLVVIDEAQDLTDEALEQLRLLSNFESDKSKWIQVILFGQPELEEKITRPHLRQFAQRVGIMERIPPLDERETGAYVAFRLARAGRADLGLAAPARRELHRVSRGLPRLINKTMGRALLIACANSGEIGKKTIREAAVSLRLARPGRLARFLGVAGTAP